MPRKQLVRRPRITAADKAAARSKFPDQPPRPALRRDSEERGQGTRYYTRPTDQALYPGEVAEVDMYGYIWTNRLDRTATWKDDNGAKHTPFRPVCLGKTGDRRASEKDAPAISNFVSAKTPEIVSGENYTRPTDHLGKNEVIGRYGGREKTPIPDALLKVLTAEGKTPPEITRELVSRGYSVSARTVYRRLSVLQSGQASLL